MVGVLVLLGLLCCVVVVGAAAGPGPLVTGYGRTHHVKPGPPPASASPSADPSSSSTTGTTRPSTQRHTPAPDWVRHLIQVVAVLAVLALLIGMFVLIRRWLSPDYVRRRQTVADDGDDVVDGLDDITELRRTVAETAAEMEQRLLSDEPGNAVIACWVELERALARAGIERRASETSSELTVRALSAVADPNAARRLEALYREARFSTHPIGEAERAAAVEALAALRTSLEVRA